MTKNEALAYSLVVGLTAVIDDRNRESARLIREPLVAEAIRKLKNQVILSEEELQTVLLASQEGHVDARIVLSDLERFGRSMAKE
jgi:hypothetical protein